MSLPAIVDSLDGLSEDIAKEYKDNGKGKFILDVTPVGTVALEDVGGLKSSLMKERKEREIAVNALKKFEGIEDPEAAKEALTKLDEVKNWKPDEKVEQMMKARTADLVTKHKKELDAKDTEFNSVEKQLQKHLIDDAITKAVIAEKGKVNILSPHLRAHVKMKNVNGIRVPSVVDEAGNERVNNSGNLMTIQELVSEYKANEEFAVAFEATGTTGSGGGGPNQRKTTATNSTSKVSKDDANAIENNLEGIASGKVNVV
jgi:hypothetical protein